MSYFAVYEVETGRLHAIERSVAVGLPPGMAYVEVEEYAGLAWNPVTLEFDPPAVDPARTISRKEFIERFTMSEWVMLVGLKATDPVIAAVFERLALLDEVELDSNFVQAACAHVVTQEYLTQERMDEVLA